MSEDVWTIPWKEGAKIRLAKLALSNYYGHIYLGFRYNKNMEKNIYYWGLDNHSGLEMVEITETLYRTLYAQEMIELEFINQQHIKWHLF